jgi:hypothetical protein
MAPMPEPAAPIRAELAMPEPRPMFPPPAEFWANPRPVPAVPAVPCPCLAPEAVAPAEDVRLAVAVCEFTPL